MILKCLNKLPFLQKELGNENKYPDTHPVVTMVATGALLLFYLFNLFIINIIYVLTTNEPTTRVAWPDEQKKTTVAINTPLVKKKKISLQPNLTLKTVIVHSIWDQNSSIVAFYLFKCIQSWSFIYN